VRDVTERKALEERLVHEALHDALTGLPNRTLLRDRLAHALSVASRRGEQLAVLFIDLDRFKVVNDSLGRALGDAILVAIAHRLSHHMRESDTLARFGGDEFVALIEGFSSIDEVQAIARRLQASLRDPFTVMGQNAFVAASIGIAVGSPGHDRADDLLREADLAMYRAKAAGRGEVLLFEPAMSDEARERMVLEMDIRKAVGQGELRLHYQPQVDLRNGQVIGVEALVRWQHPTRGLVAPTEFIPLIEDTQLIAPVGQWVLREACRQARDWRHEQPNAAMVPLHVNLSAREFQSPDIINQITSLLAEMELPAGSLGLEITEGVLIEDSASALATLQEIKRLGVLVAIDDFGTGYSSHTSAGCR
jgi:diguanylate cyclase (GGDEF)-like protein